MILFLILFSIISMFVACKTYEESRLNLPPGPRPWPVIGNFHDYNSIRHQWFNELSQIYGPIVSVWYGSTMDIVVSNSALAKEVLKDTDQHLSDRYANKLSNNRMGLIWADYGPNYVNLRKVCTLSFFSPKSLENLRPIRENEVMAMVKSIYKDCINHERKSLILREYLRPMGFNTMTRLVLGKRFVSKEGAMDEQGKTLLGIMMEKSEIHTPFELVKQIPWLTWMLRFKKAATYELEKRQHLLIKTIIEEIRVSEKTNNGNARLSFVDALISLDVNNEIIEGDKIWLIWDLITAGMDTTVITVEWAMAQLIKNPRVQQKALEELDRVIGSNRVLSETDLPKLPYLKCVAKEALRLHPPTPLLLPRSANASTNIGGYYIPKGTNVNVNVWAIARDPEVWTNPLEFRPERFIEEDVDMRGNDFRLLPFGAGRRVCPAAQLGVIMVMSTLGHLLHHFSWSGVEGVESEQIDMSGSPGLVNFMASPLRVVPTVRFPLKLCQHLEDAFSI